MHPTTATTTLAARASQAAPSLGALVCARSNTLNSWRNFCSPSLTKALTLALSLTFSLSLSLFDTHKSLYIFIINKLISDTGHRVRGTDTIWQRQR